MRRRGLLATLGSAAAGFGGCAELSRRASTAAPSDTTSSAGGAHVGPFAVVRTDFEEPSPPPGAYAAEIANLGPNGSNCIGCVAAFRCG